MKEKVRVKVFDHRPEAKWLTMEICNEYRARASELPNNGGQDIDARRDLRIELQEYCDITELQALNILHGRYCHDYVEFYQRMKNNPKLWYKEKVVDIDVHALLHGNYD